MLPISMPQAFVFLVIVASRLSSADTTAWPSVKEWKSLNRTLRGHLLAPRPPFAPCHSGQPEYDIRVCDQIKSLQTSSDFHAQTPISVDYNDEGCLPDPSYPCEPSFYPPYAINATGSDDVKAGIDFAREHGIRVTIKNTGHDFNTRSTAPRTLGVWTHNLKDFQMHDAFVPQGCKACKPGAAVTLGAGWRMLEAIAALAPYNRVIVGGADPHVGLGGFLLGGGHGPLTGVYGLGADQILEMEVITPNGQKLIVNEARFPELFWAMRGSGASTFGVVHTFTLRTYPTPHVSEIGMSMNVTGQSVDFFDAMAFLNSKMPELSDNDVKGYYVAYPQYQTTKHTGQKTGVIFASFFAFNSSAAETVKKLDFLKGYAACSKGKAVFGAEESEFENYYDWYKAKMPPQDVGYSGRLGSRLLSLDSLHDNITALRDALQASSVAPQVPLLGHVVAGKGVANAHIPGGSNAVLPAWRRTYVHYAVTTSWTPWNETIKAQATTSLLEQFSLFRKLEPNSGAYMSEGDPCEPDWQRAFYGENYERLLAIKNKWDPHRVLDCFPCVGGDQVQLRCPSAKQ